ncbi:hypothetical protein C9E88_014695 [Acinetobacter cumulans]|uniref:hypothetical protein n=1 Tax=Acinetobacter cumulans TaxID=2136182 RepID=UPI000D128D4E|nr:hypothetical protein [Acinetobacter cumulans]QCO22651.1 hypothetical protein C9E88_014695 [Acinetobacter cumulans]
MEQNRKDTLKTSIDVCPIWSMQAADKVGEMIKEIKQADFLILKEIVNGRNIPQSAGYVAETWHAESFNLDAILKDKNVRAFTDNFKGNHGLSKNNTVHDIVVKDGNKQVLTAQSKYCKDAETTANAFRELDKTNKFKYAENDIFLGPSDQLNDIKKHAQQDINTQQHRENPAVVEGATHVKNKASDRLAVDGVESTALSKKEAEHLGRGSKTGQKMHKEMQQGYLNKSTVQQSVKAAKNAAVITTVIAGTINCIEYIQKAQSGQISSDEAIQAILKNTVIAAGDSALKAGVATASVSTAAQYLPNLFTGTVFQQSLAAGSVGGAAVCAVDLVQCTVMFALGKMSGKELEERTGKNIFQTGSGVVGSAIGTSIGAIGGPPGMIIGSILGGMITSIATTIAIDNGIEKPFKESLAQTQNLVSLGNVMNDSLMYLSISQDFYADFQKGLFLSERHFNTQVHDMKKQSSRLKAKLGKF